MTFSFRRFGVGVYVVFLFALLLLFFSTFLAHATPSSTIMVNYTGGAIVVNYTGDVVANDGHCSLREAITAANTDTPSGSAQGECIAGNGDDIIHAGLYILNQPTSPLTITSNITFYGNYREGGARIGFHRFVIESGTVEFNNIHLVGSGTYNPAGASGGAIYAAEGTNLTLRDVKIDEASAAHGNATVPGGDGGAVYFLGENLLIERSLFDRNGAGWVEPGSAVRAGYGGALYIGAESTADIRLTAFVRNQVGVTGKGGAIYAEEGATVRLQSSTLAYNTANGDSTAYGQGGGLYGVAEVDSTIFGYNSADDGPDCLGTLTSLTGATILSNAQDCTFNTHPSDQVNVDPLLEPYTYGGGYALQYGSPALDTGLCYTGTRDIDHHPRPVDLPEVPNGTEACDAGAWEAQMLPITPTPSVTGSPTPVVTPSPIGTATATPTPLPPGDIVVNTVEDTVADDGTCSLREAITAANTDILSGSSAGECAAGDGHDIVIVPAGHYCLNLLGPNEDENLTGDFDIRSPMDVLGAGVDVTIIDGCHRDRLFHIFDASVVVSGMTVMDGSPPSDFSTGDSAANGGAILQAGGTLTITHSVIEDSVAGAGKNGSVRYEAGGPGGNGGGVATINGQLVIQDSVLRGNRAGFGGAGYPDDGMGGEGSGGNGGNGGGIALTGGSLRLERSTMAANLAGEGFIAQFTRGGNGGEGGGIFATGIVTILESTLRDNHAGTGATGYLDASGGGGGRGGGIFTTAAVTILASTFRDNYAGDGGMSLPRIPGFGGDGGGIFTSGAITMSESTLRDNHAGTGGLGDLGEMNLSGSGGGIAMYGPGVIQNSTISGNSDGGGEEPGTAGGVLVSNTLTLEGVTIAYNHARNGGGLHILGVGTVWMGNTVIAQNSVLLEGADCWGQLRSNGFNLIGDTADCTVTDNETGNIYDTDPFLATLANNGGPTETHALLVNSPALDAGNCFDLTTDQRGFPRPFDIPTMPNANDGCDIGAYEEQTIPPTTPTPTATHTLTPTSTATVTTTGTATATPTSTATATPTSTASATSTFPTLTATTTGTQIATTTMTSTPSVVATQQRLYLPVIQR